MKTKCLSGAIAAFGGLLLSFTAPAALAAQTQVLHSNVPAIVKSLQPLGRFPGTNRLSLAIGLPLRDQAALSNLLQQIYDPASPNYHHYLTPEQFTERFGPTEADYQAVIAFANANGLRVTTTHPNRVLLDVSGSVTDVERALHVTMQTFRHPTENRTFYAPDTEPTLDLATPVLQISGLDNYSLPRPRLVINPQIGGWNASPNSGSGPIGGYMGKDFRSAYVPDTTLTGSGQTVGLLQFDGYTASDITYYKNLAGLPNVPLQNVLLDGFSGTPTGSGGEVEVSLDIEMAISMATNLSEVIVYEAGPYGNWHDILNRMATDNLAKQLSCSWYSPGAGSDPVADQIWQQMAAQGQSFFSASGDNDAFTGLIPFPEDTPYITQVGGTTLTTSGSGGSWSSETVWNWGNGVGSGGGISTQYPIPSWQTNISMTANQGSTTMRNTPDVALTADNVYVRADGRDYNVGGTSCAAPLWAGFAALVNQQAAGAGRPPMGLVNPAIYAIGDGANYVPAFHDITTGNNESPGSPTKFSAVGGYDLCTGWGTPAGQALINALANPEALLITPPTGFISSGGFGGPFTITSQTLSLTNAGTNSLTWTLANTSAWLTVSSVGGTLAPGGPAATVTVSLNSAASNLVVGIYNATLWFTNLNDSIGQSRQVALSVISPPVITTQPTNQAVLEGAAATFTVAATGGLPLAFQWQDNGTNLADGGNISGSTTTNLIVSNVATADVGTYTVVVTNLAGAATSSNALLTLTPSAPVIVQQPADQTAIVGSTAVFTVKAIGTTPYFYQWSFCGTNIEGATNVTLTLANVQLSQAGTYAVAVTNIYGSATSSNATLNVYTVPVITAFSPQSGADGAEVNISGLNFDPVPGNNTVYLGGMKAVVSAASVTNLVVSVPVGATYAPITETVNGLTAYSPLSFLPTFSSSGVLTNTSLGTRVDLSGDTSPDQVVIADVDGDGKPDLVVHNGHNTVSIFRNISTNGSLTAGSFAPRVDLPLAGPQGVAGGVVLADLDGDGRLDIIASCQAGGTVSIYQNLCSPGTITTNSFGARVDIPVNGGPISVAVRDLDGDGRPDIVTADGDSGRVSVLRNLGTTAGMITTNSFAGQVDYPVGAGAHWVVIADLDGDGKPDVATVNYNASGMVSVLRNTSTPGSITTNSFAPQVTFATLSYDTAITIGDMDGDGKPDMVIASGPYSQVISVFRNTSTAGSITANSFAPRVDFAAGGWAQGVAVGDLDGDGKPDVAAVTQSSSHLSLFRNISTPGSFTGSSFATRLDLASGSNLYGVAIGDLDGDGRPDIVFADNNGATVSFYQNVVPFGGPPVITTQPADQVIAVGSTANFSVIAGGSIPLSYQWNFNGTNIADATNSTLMLANVQLTNTGCYAVLVTNIYGSATSSNAVLTVVLPPTITIQPTNQTVAAGRTAIFTAAASGATPLNYQWLKGGAIMTDVGNVSGTATPALTLVNVSLGDMAGYSVEVTNLVGSVTSLVATLTVAAPPSITAQPASITNTVGTAATFTVTASGTPPLSYQWNFNGTNIASATNTTLTLSNVQLTNAGNFAVLVTNYFGHIMSFNALLTVNPPPTNIPVITAFSPTSGFVDVSVTITGLNFSPVAASNTVYLGGMKAVVSAASVTNLVVSVPVGATYAPITETVNGLTAYSPLSFLPTFSSSGVLTNTSLGTRVDLSGDTSPDQVVIADVDGDGKPDLVVHNGHNTVSIFRNISTNGSLTAGSFAPRVDLPLAGPQGVAGGVVLADLDGDGRLDIIASCQAGGTVSIYQNLCSPGTITTNSFGARVDIPVNGGPISVAVRDLDGDGRPDIVTADGDSGRVSVLRNLGTTAGMITTNSFAGQVDYPVGAGAHWVVIADLDGDGKPDVATVNYNASGMVSVLRNTSTPGSITTNSFAPQVTFATLSYDTAITIGDMDGDGKPDMVIASGPYSQVISVFRNTSTAGSITANSFAPRVDFAAGGWAQGVAVGDLDGDGKPDVAAVTQSSSHLSLFRNISTPGSFTGSSFATRLDLASGSNLYGVAIGDLDGDGRPDIVFADNNGATVSFYQNVVPARPFIISQPVSSTNMLLTTATFSVAANGTSPLRYQWNFNGTNIMWATNATLILTNVQLSQAGNYSVLVTNAYGSILSSNATLIVNPLLYFVWSQVPSPRFATAPFAVVIQAQNLTNGIVTNFTGTVVLLSTNGAPVSPAVSGNFIQGVWTGAVTVAQTATNLVLQATDNLGESGLANPINILNLPALTTLPSSGTLMMLWPVSPSGFVLETTAGLSPANWVPVTTPPFQIGDQYLLSIPMSGTNAFYRLRFNGQ